MDDGPFAVSEMKGHFECELPWALLLFGNLVARTQKRHVYFGFAKQCAPVRDSCNSFDPHASPCAGHFPFETGTN
jgi:hypothetical protein